MTLLSGLPKQHFGAILVDPPWAFKSYAPPSKNPQSRRDVDRHYQTMKLPEIKALPIKAFAAKTGCHLFLCATGPCLREAFEVMDAWGFKYSTVAFTWVKFKRSFNSNQLRILPSADGDFHVGLGFTTRKNAEFVLLGRMGSAKRQSKKVRELILAPVREHSRKPEELRQRIEQYCVGPYLELFGREERPNWTVRGDQVGKFSPSLVAAE